MQIKSKEKEFFNNWSNSDEYDVLTSSAYRRIVRNFIKLIGDRGLKRCCAVDLGCGTGIFTKKFFYEINGSLFGMDISLNSIFLARQKDSNVCYLAGDIEHLAFKDESFDIIVFSGVLHHFTDLEQCLKEGFRVLRKGGCMLSYDPNIKNPFMWLYRHPSSPFFSSLGKTDNERLLSFGEMDMVMSRVGFKKVTIYGISGITFKYVESRIGRYLLPLYNLIERGIGVLSLSRKYGSFLICYGEKR